MKMIPGEGLTYLVKVLLDLILLGGMAIYLSLPWGLGWYLGLIFTDSRAIYLPYLIFLYASGLFALLIVYEMRRIFIRLCAREPFIEANVRSLLHVGYASLAIGVIYFTKLFYLNTLLTLVAVMIFVIAGLFALVLARVFQQAVEVKAELDLTI